MTLNQSLISDEVVEAAVTAMENTLDSYGFEMDPSDAMLILYDYLAEMEVYNID